MPATILHGLVRDVNPVGAGAEVTVTCDAGYGHTYSVKCLDAGHWNDSLDCTGKCVANVVGEVKSSFFVNTPEVRNIPSIH